MGDRLRAPLVKVGKAAAACTKAGATYASCVGVAEVRPGQCQREFAAFVACLQNALKTQK